MKGVIRWLLISVLLGACSAPPPTVTPAPSPSIECRLDSSADCATAVSQAIALLNAQDAGLPQNLVVIWGRSPSSTWHAEVHACFADGRYLLVDVISRFGAPPSASLREGGSTTSLCGPSSVTARAGD